MSVVNQAIVDLILVRDDDNQAVTGLTAGSFDTLEAFLIATPATTAAVTLAELGGGEYRASFVPTAVGAWALHYVYAAASLFDFKEEERRYEVTAGAPTTVLSVGYGDAYALTADLKARLGITGTDEDARCAALLAAASRQIDGWTGRQFGNSGTPTAKFLNPHAYDVLTLPDAVSVSEIAGDIALNRTFTDIWDPADYDLYPSDAADNGQPYTEIRTTWRTRRVFILLARSVRVTAIWGWPAVPSSVQEATLMQAARLFNRQFAPLGLSGSGELSLTAVPRVDPDVQALIGQYRAVAF